MSPARFTLFVLAAMAIGGLLGGIAGGSVPVDPFESRRAELRRAETSAEALSSDVFFSAFETGRRMWRAGGAAVGATLGLSFAAVVGGYSLRFRTAEKRTEYN